MYQHYQQQPSQHQRPQQPQQQQHAMGVPQNRGGSDPIVTREMYRSELASLTFNSKPIITSLTIAAGENVSVSKVIVQTIEERLRTAPPNQKLPTLYLIDSIIKNVGGPYLNLFARTIVNLFLDAYAVVDSSAKASFEKVLGTWPNWNSQLFPRDVIARMERGVQSMRQQYKSQYQQSGMHVNPHFSDRPRDPRDPRDQDAYSQGAGNTHRPPPPAAAAPQSTESSADNVLLQDIQLLMLQKQQAMIMNPSDQASAKQVAILQQLETIVKTTQLTPDNANMIRQQLAQLWTPVPIPPVVPGFASGAMSQAMTLVSSPMPPNMMMVPPPASLPPHRQTPMVPPSPAVFAPHLLPQGSMPSPQPMMASLPVANMPISNAPLPMPPMHSMPMNNAVAPPQPVVASIPPVVPPAANSLFASLMQSGLLGPNGALGNLNLAPQSPLVPAAGSAATATPPPANATHDRSDQSELDRSVMSLGRIELTSQDIQRRRPAAIQVMYGVPPLQCNQCGYRCPKSADAQKKMDAHLDWHFRQNRRMKDKAKKSHSRSWLVGEEDWIHSREGDMGHNQQPVFFDFASGMTKTSKDEMALQEEIAALKEQISSESSLIHNLAVPESEAAVIIAKGCSVCKEKFTKVWNEPEEEWSYKNATVIDKMIYHATCHADLVRSNQRQAALAEAAAAVAAAAATASATSTNTTNSAESSPKDFTNAGLSVEQTKSEIDFKAGNMENKMDINTDVKTEATEALGSIDQEMTGPESDAPTSLKRKIEDDLEAENQMATKRAILEQDV
ncbi:hypothetical protein BGZ70_007547 [Mortierella alpina]|uniref:CID domain-containing protein n=1 Tax=Mortierella alpina TaxID=64518 RepID=A0A9P6J5I1_MORAP|nr:hypothetical protein BGZ70_007547 [Mortierella alpina]